MEQGHNLGEYKVERKVVLNESKQATEFKINVRLKSPRTTRQQNSGSTPDSNHQGPKATEFRNYVRLKSPRTHPTPRRRRRTERNCGWCRKPLEQGALVERVTKADNETKHIRTSRLEPYTGGPTTAARSPCSPYPRGDIPVNPHT